MNYDSFPINYFVPEIVCVLLKMRFWRNLWLEICYLRNRVKEQLSGIFPPFYPNFDFLFR